MLYIIKNRRSITKERLFVLLFDISELNDDKPFGGIFCLKGVSENLLYSYVWCAGR